MKIQDSVAFVTGANRGLGLAFARELGARGVAARALDGLESGSEEVLADEQTNAIKRSLPTAQAYYLNATGLV